MKLRTTYATVAALAAAAALALAHTALASTFQVRQSDNRFSVIRSGEGTNTAETVYYRVVNISAYAGQNFAANYSSLSFSPGETNKIVTVSEQTPSQYAFRYQTGTTRSYGFELVDVGGFKLVNYAVSRSYTTGSQFSTSYLNKSVTDLVYFDNNGVVKSDGGNKYLDVACPNTSRYTQVTDGGYGQGVHTISTGALFGNSSDLRTYLNSISYKMYATIYFTQKEEQDGYQYIQILADNATTCDGNDSNGTVSNPSVSLYKACFILSYNPSGSVMSDDHHQFFPHRYDYVDKSTEISAGLTRYEFDYDNSHLYLQRFKNESYDTSTSGSIVLYPTVNNLNVRFDAAGSGGDNWDFKDLTARLALRDPAAPNLTGVSVSAGPYRRGNSVSVSLAFDEIVVPSPTTGFYLKTSWGSLGFNSGSRGSNVLTFSGSIDSSVADNTALTISGFSLLASLKDLAGNEVSLDGLQFPAPSGVTISPSFAYPIYYDLAGGAIPGGSSNPATYTYDDSTFLLVNPVRIGYIFDGWSGTGLGDLTNAVSIANHSHGVRAYAAHWTPITYTVHFNANGGDGTMSDQCFTYDEPQALASNAFTRASFAFGGWRRAVGGATTYADGATVANLAAQQDDVVTLDAVWTPTPTWTGDGSSDSPYLITTREQLADLAAYANGGFDPYDDACYKLMSDIAYDPAATNSYTPIYNGGFVFDGNGHTISGIRISRPDEDEQGLFGLFDGGVVKNLTLADSVIEGNDDIGGIVGRFYGGLIQNCFVIGTTISDYGGAVVGYIPTRGEGTLSNCAYHDCTPARGIGNEDDRSGEVEKVFALSFGDGVEPIVPPQYAFPVYGETNSYYAAGQNVIVRVDEGAFVLVNGGEEGVTDLGNGEFLFLASADAAVTHAVTYIDDSGIERQCTNFTVLASAAGNATYGTSGAESWYVVTTNVTIGGRLLFNDSSVHLILCDGASLAVTNSAGSHAIQARNLTIYGQAAGTGAVYAKANGNFYGIVANISLTVNGGRVTAIGNYGISAGDSLTVNGGRVAATGNIYGIYAYANIRLGWMNSADSIYANSYFYRGDFVHVIKTGQSFVDGDGHAYQGDIDDPAALAGKTLQPAVPYIDADGHQRYCTGFTVLAGAGDNARIAYGASGAESWYVVLDDVAVDGKITFNDSAAHLILCDGASLVVTNSTPGDEAVHSSGSLAVYGQANGTGAVAATGVDYGIYAWSDITINGGRVTAAARANGVYANEGCVVVNGGSVNACGICAGRSITLGWMNLDDSIYADIYDGTIHVKDGQMFIDDDGNIYEGSLNAGDITHKTLHPALPGITYIDADGHEQTQYRYTVLANAAGDVTYGTDGEEEWYVVTTNVSIGGMLQFNGSTNHLIVCDGATLAVTNEYNDAIKAVGVLSIYGQADGTGTLDLEGDDDGIEARCGLVVNGGVVNANGNFGIYSPRSVTINGGRVSAVGDGDGFYVYDDIILGWRTPTDSIYASSYYVDCGIYVKTGQTLTDGTDIYTGGPIHGYDIEEKTLRPYVGTPVPYMDENGNEQQCFFYTVITSAAGIITYGADDEEAWYVVTNDVTVSGMLRFNDSVTHLIICDGASLSVTNTNDVAFLTACSISVYGQAGGTGRLSAATSGADANGITVCVGDFTVNGVTVAASGGEQGCGIYADGVTVNGGTVAASGGNCGMRADSVVLGWDALSDSVYACSYYAYGDICVKPGLRLTDGAALYQGALDPAAIAGKTLRPYAPPVPYIDENGEERTCCKYFLLASAAGDVTYGTSDAEAWYVVTTNVSISGKLRFDGYTHLIVCDGATLAVTNALGDAVYANEGISVYGQANGTGTLDLNGGGDGIASGGLVVNGGVLNAYGDDAGIYSWRSATINGGRVSAVGGGTGAYVWSGFTIGWRAPTDSIYASSYRGFIYVKPGQTLTDGTDTYTGGPLDKAALAGKTLRPYALPVTYIDENGEEQQCCTYTVITNAADYSVYGTAGEEGWYVVDGDVSIRCLRNSLGDGALRFNGSTNHLIVCDGASLVVDNTGSGSAIYAGGVLAVYGQVGGTGAVTAYAGAGGNIRAGGVVVNGGNVTAITTAVAGDTFCIRGSNGIVVNGGAVFTSGAECGIRTTQAGGDITINGGVVSNVTSDIGILTFRGNVIINGGGVYTTQIFAGGDTTSGRGSVTVNGGVVEVENSISARGDNTCNVIVNGGNVTAYDIYVSGSATLGWTSLADSISVAHYACGTVGIKAGQTLTDGTNLYQVAASSDDLVEKTLRPYVSDPPFPSYLDGADDQVKTNYVSWAMRNGYDLGSEHEVEFLVDVAPGAGPVELRIDGIEVGEGGAAVCVTCRAGASAEAGAVDMSRINGVLCVEAGDEPGSLTPTAVPSANVSYEGGSATIVVPSSAGTFIRARVGVATPSPVGP